MQNDCQAKQRIKGDCPARRQRQYPAMHQRQRQYPTTQQRQRQYPAAQQTKTNCEDQPGPSAPWNSPSVRERSYSRSSSCSGSSINNCPQELTNPFSDIRGNEAVDRVADTVAMMNSPEDPFQMFRNKDFRCFYNREDQPLCIPKQEKDLMKGDFDILIIHPRHGYIHIEVKATGDFPTHVTEEDRMKAFVKVLREKAEKTLRKGRQALSHMQPKGDTINIISTLALPNTSREFLKRALAENPQLHKALGALLDPHSPNPGETDVENLCLCADDLPLKDGIIDTDDVNVKRRVNTWWMNITHRTPSARKPSKSSIETILASFFKDEKVKAQHEFVHETGELLGTLSCNEEQRTIIEKDHQYMFITGIPGCGKTTVLALKALQWLENSQVVFLVYKDGSCTSQPGTEYLKYYMQTLSKNDNLQDKFPKLCSFGLPSNANVKDFIDIMIQEFIKHSREGNKDDEVGSSRREDADHVNKWDAAYMKLQRFQRQRDDSAKVHAPDLNELKQCFPNLQLESMGTSPRGSSSLENAKEMEQATESPETGRGLYIIIDEIIWRTINGKRAELVSRIMTRLPEARIWGAGPFRTDSPKGFIVENLTYSYRCPPTAQRLLEATEPYCHKGKTVYDYCTRSTSTPSSHAGQYRLPVEGPDPVFLSHALHGSGEIIQCAQCAKNLVRYLKNDLRIRNSTQSGSSETRLREKDVLIVLTGIETCNNMARVAYSELYRQLTRAEGDHPGYDVLIYENSMRAPYDPLKSKITILHVRAAGGLEKKVVIYVPCCQYKAQPQATSPATYADVVRRSLAGPSPHDLQSLAEDVMGKLQQCQHITQVQRQALATLGKLNLHWLWYVAGRTLAQLIVFHF